MGVLTNFEIINNFTLLPFNFSLEDFDHNFTEITKDFMLMNENSKINQVCGDLDRKIKTTASILYPSKSEHEPYGLLALITIPVVLCICFICCYMRKISMSRYYENIPQTEVKTSKSIT